MKRSVSRASKASIDGHDFSDNPFPGVSDSEWQEYLEKEDTDLFLLSVREEIVQKCMEICTKNYLEKQAVGFTVHCAYLAWCKVFDMYNMFRDPGDTDDPEVRDSWEPDPEPSPSLIDSWGVECIQPLDPKVLIRKDGKVSRRESKPVSEYIPESLESFSFISDLFEPEEGGYLFLPELVTSESVSQVTREPSIFTKTLSMTRESLPLVKPITAKSVCTGHVLHKKKNI